MQRNSRALCVCPGVRDLVKCVAPQAKKVLTETGESREEEKKKQGRDGSMNEKMRDERRARRKTGEIHDEEERLERERAAQADEKKSLKGQVNGDKKEVE